MLGHDIDKRIAVLPQTQPQIDISHSSTDKSKEYYDSLLSDYQNLVGYGQVAIAAIPEPDTSVATYLRLQRNYGNKTGRKMFKEYLARRDLCGVLANGLVKLDYALDFIDTLKVNADKRIKLNIQLNGDDKPLGMSDTCEVVAYTAAELAVKWPVNVVAYKCVEYMILGLGGLFCAEVSIPPIIVVGASYYTSSWITSQIMDKLKNSQSMTNTPGRLTQEKPPIIIFNWNAPKQKQMSYVNLLNGKMRPYVSTADAIDQLSDQSVRFCTAVGLPLFGKINRPNLKLQIISPFTIKTEEVKGAISAQPKQLVNLKPATEEKKTGGISIPSSQVQSQDSGQLKRKTDKNSSPLTIVHPCNIDFSVKTHSLQIYQPTYQEPVQETTKNSSISVWTNGQGRLQVYLELDVANSPKLSVAIGAGLLFVDFVKDRFLSEGERATKSLPRDIRKLNEAINKDWTSLSVWRHPQTDYQELIEIRKSEVLDSIAKIRKANPNNPDTIHICRLLHYLVASSKDDETITFPFRGDLAQHITKFQNDHEQLCGQLNWQINLKDWLGAKNTLQRLGGCFPDDPKIYLLQAKYYDRRGKFDAAERSIKKAEALATQGTNLAQHVHDEWLNPEDPYEKAVYRKELAIAAAEQDRIAVRNAKYNHYLHKVNYYDERLKKMDSDTIPSHLDEQRNINKDYYKAQKEKCIVELQEYCQRTVNECPDDRASRQQFVTALLLDKRYTSAAKQQKELCDSKGHLPEDYFYLAWIYDQDGNKDEALEWYNKYSIKSQNSDFHYYAKGRLRDIYREKNQLEKALEEAENICKLPNHHPSDDYDLAVIYIKSDKIEQGIKKFTETISNFESKLQQKISLSEQDSRLLSLSHYNLAMYYHSKNDVEKTIAHFKGCLSASPDERMIDQVSNCAKAYLEADRTGDAKKLIQIVLDNNSRNVVAKDFQQKVYAQQRTDRILFATDMLGRLVMRYVNSVISNKNSSDDTRIVVIHFRITYNLSSDMLFNYMRKGCFLSPEKWGKRTGLHTVNKLIQLGLELDDLYSIKNKGNRYLTPTMRDNLAIVPSVFGVFTNVHDAFYPSKDLIVRNINLQRSYAIISLVGNVLDVYEFGRKKMGKLLHTDPKYHLGKQVIGNVAAAGGLVIVIHNDHPGFFQDAGEQIQIIADKYNDLGNGGKAAVIIGGVVIGITLGACAYKKIQYDRQVSQLNTLLENTNICINNKDIDGAIKFTNDFLQIQEDPNVRIRLNRLMAFRELQKARTDYYKDNMTLYEYEEKLSYYIKLTPEDKDAKIEQNVLLACKLLINAKQDFKEGKTIDGIAKLRDRITLQPDNPEAKETLSKALCVAYIMENKPIEAIAACESRLVPNNKDSHALLYKAYAYLQMEDINAAEGVIKDLLSFHPHDPSVHQQVALLRQSQGDTEQARYHCDVSIKLFNKQLTDIDQKINDLTLNEAKQTRVVVNEQDISKELLERNKQAINDQLENVNKQLVSIKQQVTDAWSRTLGQCAGIMIGTLLSETIVSYFFGHGPKYSSHILPSWERYKGKGPLVRDPRVSTRASLKMTSKHQLWQKQIEMKQETKEPERTIPLSSHSINRSNPVISSRQSLMFASKHTFWQHSTISNADKKVTHSTLKSQSMDPRSRARESMKMAHRPTIWSVQHQRVINPVKSDRLAANFLERK